MQDVLQEIIVHKKKEVALLKERVSLAELEKQLEKVEVPFYSLKKALIINDGYRRIKRRSPSKVDQSDSASRR